MITDACARLLPAQFPLTYLRDLLIPARRESVNIQVVREE